MYLHDKYKFVNAFILKVADWRAGHPSGRAAPVPDDPTVDAAPVDAPPVDAAPVDPVPMDASPARTRLLVSPRLFTPRRDAALGEDEEDLAQPLVPTPVVSVIEV